MIWEIFTLGQFSLRRLNINIFVCTSFASLSRLDHDQLRRAALPTGCYMQLRSNSLQKNQKQLINPRGVCWSSLSDSTVMEMKFLTDNNSFSLKDNPRWKLHVQNLATSARTMNHQDYWFAGAGHERHVRKLTNSREHPCLRTKFVYRSQLEYRPAFIITTTGIVTVCYFPHILNNPFKK